MYDRLGRTAVNEHRLLPAEESARVSFWRADVTLPFASPLGSPPASAGGAAHRVCHGGRRRAGAMPRHASPLSSIESVARDEVILDAAEKLFFERGFNGVGVDEIGQVAGVTGSAIYRHFDSKD